MVSSFLCSFLRSFISDINLILKNKYGKSRRHHEVEGARLEGVYTSNRIVGSNPILVVIIKFIPKLLDSEKKQVSHLRAKHIHVQEIPYFIQNYV